MTSSKPKVKVVVVGAGVLGLTSALLLLKANYDVTVIGKHLPGDTDADYTSSCSIANWVSTATDDEEFTQHVHKVGYRYFMELARSDESCGVHMVPHQHNVLRADGESESSFSDSSTSSSASSSSSSSSSHSSHSSDSALPVAGNSAVPWFIRQNFVEGIKFIGDGETSGYSFQTVTIEASKYLCHLKNEIERHGGVLGRRSINHINEAYYLHDSHCMADLVINCTGLASTTLGGVEDHDVIPVKTQTVWTNNTISKQISLNDPNSGGEGIYVYPRMKGGTIISGSYIRDSSSSTDQKKLSKRLIKRATRYIAELTDTKTRGNTKEICKYRQDQRFMATKANGPRVEREGTLIHNYAVCRYGFVSSIALAEKVVRLANEFVAIEHALNK
ncbi:hypothetical protein WICPIJ_008873 [Wickerhamomyces pijperi]|uniref:FAD dependent oxidoreductase domain-containing protein n=1 Tax=Wickerhamomyces pijperi TaxID=599730 RepID=A0A9P8TGR6_WICPI|nr:hypothetical protein WICPIJ_008873 [Wickerhamomyces pijperi]